MALKGATISSLGGNGGLNTWVGTRFARRATIYSNTT
jgi:hypothetical protein